MGGLRLTFSHFEPATVYLSHGLCHWIHMNHEWWMTNDWIRNKWAKNHVFISCFYHKIDFKLIRFVYLICFNRANHFIISLISHIAPRRFFLTIYKLEQEQIDYNFIVHFAKGRNHIVITKAKFDCKIYTIFTYCK